MNSGTVAGGAQDTGWYRHVLEATSDLVYILSADGAILEANPQLCRVLRVPREKLIGTKITAYLDRDYTAITERVLKDIAVRRLPLRSTRVYQIQGAESQTYEAMESPLIRDGKVYAIAGIGREITQEIVLERKLWDMDENRQWAVDFALRTALGLVKGYIYTLCQGGMTDEERRKRYARIIEEEIDHISKIVEDMLDIRRLENSEFKLTGDVVDVGDCIAHVLLSCEDEALLREISLVADCPRNMNPLYVPREALIRILYNLVLNAIHYAVHEGKVVVEARDYENYVEIHIKDNGVGIPDDEIPFIFEKYYRGKNSSALPTQGSGLGLAISRILVEALGGKVWACSRVGAGSDFGFVIPRQPFDFTNSNETELWKLSSVSADTATSV